MRRNSPRTSGSIGAVGILAERISRTKQLEQEGLDVRVVSAGKFKSEGHEALPVTDAEQKALQRRVDAAYTTFVDDIAAGRHVLAATVRAGFGQGRLVDAADARKLHMIDAIARTDVTLARALASPAALTAQLKQRAEQLRARTDRERLDLAHEEIAAHRARLHASMQRIALR